MAIRHYLAMTGPEIRRHLPDGQPIAWLAAHFSPYGRGLSNLPGALPAGSVLILDDITPIHGHDPEYIADQLLSCAEVLELGGILLDFQRPGYREAEELAAFLCGRLPCPAGVSAGYGKDLTCPVFLPPLPPSESLTEHLLPYYNREVWLDLAPAAQVITLTPAGAVTEDSSPAPLPQPHFADETLHCHYCIEEGDNALKFHLCRTPEDLEGLRSEAEALGVTKAFRLLQDFPEGAE